MAVRTLPSYVLLLLSTMLPPPALAQAAPTLTLSEPAFQRGGTEHTWQYQVGLQNVPPNTETVFALYLRVPERAQVHNINESGVTSTSSRLASFAEVTFKTTASATVTLTVTGLAIDVKAGPAVEHQWRVGDGDRQRLTASAPEVLYDPSLIRFVFGSGLSFRTDDHIDFLVSGDEKTLLIKNDSRNRAAGTVGALFEIGQFKSIGSLQLQEVHPVDLLLSLDFSPQTGRNVDGIMFGLAVGVHKYLSLGLGYRLGLGTELSPGFQRDAVALVTELREDDTHKSRYSRFEKLASDQELYDGFRLIDPRTDQPFFPGNPIIDSYNNTWFLGAFIPLDFRDLFSARNGS